MHHGLVLVEENFLWRLGDALLDKGSVVLLLCGEGLVRDIAVSVLFTFRGSSGRVIKRSKVKKAL